ncbi:MULTISPECIES: DUF1877 family protein [unclassified Streptomyces]|uniref:DUF1877 family protein n=1 Tax=unclassified Streptomyces TaxID=2593676 RepID=UPI0008DD4531|nr:MULTISPECIES: DUF1877 family protein [unclassified Streptomyces]OII66405.1 hypothetical protein BJP39_08720 [Streptomyces sp. CC77]
MPLADVWAARFEGVASVRAFPSVEGVRPAELAQAEIYPTVLWERGESLDYVTSHYQAMAPFFRAAADAGDAMLVWLD